MKNNNLGISAVIGIILMIAISVAICSIVYVYVSTILYDDDEYYSVTGEVIKTEIFVGGCQHTDFCNVYFANTSAIWFNPSIDIVEFLPLNETYTFHLKDETNMDGYVVWCDRIDNQYGEEIWRSCRYD